MSWQKDKGTRFERQTADYLTMRLGDEIERKPLHGAKDTGDISGLKLRGMRCVVECKDQKHYKWNDYFDEMLTEKANDDAEIGLCVFHKPSVGPKKFGRNIVLMELDDLLAVAVGGHSLLHGNPTAAAQDRLRERVAKSSHSIRQLAKRAGIDEGVVKNLLYKPEFNIGKDKFEAIEGALNSWNE